jgi:hypothetical protein
VFLGRPGRSFFQPKTITRSSRQDLSASICASGCRKSASKVVETSDFSDAATFELENLWPINYAMTNKASDVSFSWGRSFCCWTSSPHQQAKHQLSRFLIRLRAPEPCRFRESTTRRPPGAAPVAPHSLLDGVPAPQTVLVAFGGLDRLARRRRLLRGALSGGAKRSQAASCHRSATFAGHDFRSQNFTATVSGLDSPIFVVHLS